MRVKTLLILCPRSAGVGLRHATRHRRSRRHHRARRRQRAGGGNHDAHAPGADRGAGRPVARLAGVFARRAPRLCLRARRRPDQDRSAARAHRQAHRAGGQRHRRGHLAGRPPDRGFQLRAGRGEDIHRRHARTAGRHPGGFGRQPAPLQGGGAGGCAGRPFRVFPLRRRRNLDRGHAQPAPAAGPQIHQYRQAALRRHGHARRALLHRRTFRRGRAGAARPVAAGQGRAPRAGRLWARAGTLAGLQDAAHGLLGAGRRQRLRAGGGAIRGAGDRPERTGRKRGASPWPASRCSWWRAPTGARCG